MRQMYSTPQFVRLWTGATMLCIAGKCRYARALRSLRFVAAGCVVALGANAAGPNVSDARALAAAIRTFPEEGNFGYEGAAFFHDKLYVTCNLGLVVLDEDRPIEWLRWGDRHRVLSGPWTDRAGSTLWIQRQSDGQLWRFDAKRWREIDLPRKPGLTRGDVLRGFRMVAASEGLWLEGAGKLWKWGGSDWIPEELPAIPFGETLCAFFPLDRRLMVSQLHGVYRPRQMSTTVHLWAGSWVSATGADCAGVAQYTTTATEAFVLLLDGKICRVLSAGLAAIETPGECEAITTTTDGYLLASFPRHGVFKLKAGEWSRLFSSPYSEGLIDHRAVLAENRGRVALVTARGRVASAHESGIWMWTGKVLKHIDPK